MLETAIYKLRFSDDDLAEQRYLWAPICRFLQPYVRGEGSTLDLGAGFCHFINNIRSRIKVAVDLNGESLRRYAADDVRCVVSSGADLSEIQPASIDSVFASNVYEHFQSREDVAQSFREVYRVLRPGGRLIILQPNFAYCYRSYFDFFDHRLIFTHKGMVEGLQISGFEMERVIARFLPYTSKSRLPRWPWLVSLYLRLPVAWKIFGGQMLLVARKN